MAKAVAITEPKTISGGAAAQILTTPRKINSSATPTTNPFCKSPKTRPTKQDMTSGCYILDRPKSRESMLPKTPMSPIKIALTNIYIPPLN